MPDATHTADLEADLARIAHQEATLLLPHFDNHTAWQLGSTLHDLAVARAYNIVIDIRRFGTPHQPLFYAAMPNTTPDNPRWVQRKTNVVSRFHKSSYAIGLTLELNNRQFAERYNLPDEDYAAHGGCFPIRVASAGLIGSITISGLTQREDHNLAVEALCLHLNLDYPTLKLS